MKALPTALALLLAATAAAYLPAQGGAPVLDDLVSLQDPLVLAPGAHGPGEWLRAPRPVTTATFALQAALGGLAPRPLHAGNVALHLAAVLLAFLVARETLRRASLRAPEGPALAAAALFALHPLQTGAVAYLTQRAEVLAAVLTLAALHLLLARDLAGVARRALYVAAAIALHALALGAKPVAAVLPALWLLHVAAVPPPGEDDIPPLRRALWRLPLALPLLALSALAAAGALARAAGSPHAGLSVPGLGAGTYLATEATVIPRYLGLALWPAGQCGDWGVVPARAWLAPGVLAGAAFLAALAAAALAVPRLAAGRKGDGPAVLRVAAFGALLFLAALAPTSSVVPLVDPMAEHRAYLALLGPALALSAAAAVAVRRLAPGRSLPAGAALALAACAALGAATWRRSAVWADPLTFWSDAAACAPGKARAQLNHGVALGQAGRTAEAVEALLRARALARDGTVSPEVVLSNLASTLLELGRVGEAGALAAEELARAPGSAVALAQLAAAEHGAGRWAACEEAARAATQAPPSRSGIPAQALGAKWLGMCRLRRGEAALALPALRAAAAALPGEFDLLLALGEAEGQAGARPASCAAFARAEAAAPAPRWAAHARAAAERAGCGAR